MYNTFKIPLCIAIAAMIAINCKKDENDPPAEPIPPDYSKISLSTDKARYNPGDNVVISLGTSYSNPLAN